MPHNDNSHDAYDALLPPAFIDDDPPPPRRFTFSPAHRVFLTILVTEFAFCLTDTTLLYAFKRMICDEYYKDHEWDHTGRHKCSVPAVAASYARSYSLAIGIMTVAAVVSVFATNSLITKYGPRKVFTLQPVSLFLCILIQTYGLSVGGLTGVHILQWSGLVYLFGSGAGLRIASNVLITRLVSEEERTGAFGVIDGMFKIGTALGYAFDGYLYDTYGLYAPFKTGLAMSVICIIVALLILPEVPETAQVSQESPSESLISPLKVFMPRKNHGPSGRRGGLDWNVTLLGLGIFFTVMVTGYFPRMLKMAGMDMFGMSAKTNGIMTSLNMLLEALFLTILFPRIIKWGRSRAPAPPSSPSPLSPLPAQDTFDLYFLQASALFETIVTFITTLAQSSWQIFTIAMVLPLSSGLSPACTGVLVNLVDESQQADALSAISLVGWCAYLTAVSLFGTIYASLNKEALGRLIFLVNGCAVLLAFIMFALIRNRRVSRLPGAYVQLQASPVA
ncbi:hypothetical protein L202_03025 [Cryptococcus amylolentus CBS 6039]|uniref:Major facilitator superfamily (MFS) profile domain-containing protein n=2 Tax=Cryptococcus amylolentus TaxID=104669 RepID=A0A1E3HX65_9TREE|nr:hypothetical protein L202_03025 [Cryptococcus amylolentus CBS 6039]ODN80897.1 hypothetical protein L202_03025 [Cryptococcus amylolentus CBS 6039]ODO09399.1 hypothetical protein I350_02999 [Cryptococcus amylolentus CBS 6273]